MANRRLRLQHSLRLATTLIGGLAVAALLTAGCDGLSGEKRANEHPFVGETVALAVPQGLPLGDGLRLVLDEWSEQTGATCRVVEFADNGPATAAGDVVLLPFASLSQLAADNRLARIPDSRRTDDAQSAGVSAAWLDIFPGLRERALSVGGQPTVVPVSCPVLTCCLRRDLLEKAGLKPPETWEAYQVLLGGLGKWAPGLTAVEPWSEEFRATMFLARALPYVQHPAAHSVFFDIDNGAPLIDSPGFVRALGEARDAVARLSADTGRLTVEDCRRFVLEGRAAMAIAFEPGRSDAPPVTRGAGIEVTFVPLPGTAEFYSRRAQGWESPREKAVNRATLCPFSGLALGVASGLAPPRSQAAWNLVTFLSLDRYDAAFAGIPKSVSRESQLAPPAAWVSPDLRPDELFSYLNAHSESLRQPAVVPELAVIGRQRFREALTTGITAALDGKATPESALKQVADRWRAIANELGTERVRDSYRNGLGLSPALTLPAATPTKPPVTTR